MVHTVDESLLDMARQLMKSGAGRDQR